MPSLPPLLQAESPCDLVWCSHAHPEAAVGLREFHDRHPQIPIYASEVTARLLPLNWAGVETIDWITTLPWQESIAIDKDLSIEIFPAGHLPGGAGILLTDRRSNNPVKLLYLGEFALANFRFADGLHLESVGTLRADIAILNATHGSARYPHRRQQENQLMAQIDACLQAGNTAILPVEPWGMAQELLLACRSHHLFTGKDIDIWVDESIANACKIYTELLPYFPSSVRNFARHQPLFWDRKIRPYTRVFTEKLTPRKPSIAIVDRLTDWQSRVIPANLPQVTFLNSFNRQITTVEEIEVGTIETYSLAEHADGIGTIQLIHNIRPKHVILIGSAPHYLQDLASLEELANRYRISTPSAGTLVPLPIGETFLQPAAPKDNSYEGELTELTETIEFTLPISIADDPRWRHFAETGIIGARWQGDELVLHGISPRELLHRSPPPTSRNTCTTCAFHLHDRCLNPSSSLYSFKVAPDASCLEFAPSH